MPIRHDAPAADCNCPLTGPATGSAAREEGVEHDAHGSCKRARITALEDPDRPGTRRHLAFALHALMRRSTAMALCVLLGHGVPTALGAVPAPGDASISLTGVPGMESETHTLSFVLGAGEKPPVLIAGDLLRTAPSPARIDRSHVRVTPVATSPAGRANFEITVTGLPQRYGSYQGTITARDDAGSAGGSGSIAVTLLVQAAATMPLAPVPAKIELPLAAGSTSGRSVLSNWPSVGDTLVTIAGLPAGVVVADARTTPLVSARGYGELGYGTDTDKKQYSVNATHDGLRFRVDASQTKPDKYSATAEIDLAGSDRRISVPIEVTVRAAPVYVVALLLLGILLGRAAKWMNEGGQKLLAAQEQLNSLMLRASALDSAYRVHLEQPIAGLQRILIQNRLSDFDAASSVTLALIKTIERVSSLRALATLKGNAAAVTSLDEIAAELRFLDSPESAKGRLDEIESKLTNGLGNAVATTAAAGQERSAHDSPTKLHSTKLRLAGKLRTALELAGVALLACVGYEVLYLKGPPTFGADFSDYFGVLVWGLGADVTGRTITTLGHSSAR